MNCSQIGGIVGLVEMFIELVRIDGNYQNLGTPSIYLWFLLAYNELNTNIYTKLMRNKS